MRPITIVWPSVTDSAAAVVSSAAITQNVALPFATKNYIATPTSLKPILAYEMPEGIVRNIVVTAVSGTIVGQSFTVVGYNQNFDLLTEVIAAGAQGVLFYKYIVSITPTAAVVGTVNVGLGQSGTTILSPMDVYNKNNNFTLAYDVGGVGTVSLVPYYTVNQIVDFSGTTQTILETISLESTVYYALPIANANFINSPSSAVTSPITANSSYSFVGIPLTGLLSTVTTTTGGTFVQTIIQQGAAY